ncbi:hypothetical protein EYF80_057063 [Liparis tanakae]|uniref:Uncharacterized protein n=1 Tax=Liparis tanakae TaxID=230148 RepID=A0A4Z2EV86_9TELE|nr:hypothetical protein EYF80_057063 [Liparis tanakae]
MGQPTEETKHITHWTAGPPVLFIVVNSSPRDRHVAAGSSGQLCLSVCFASGPEPAPVYGCVVRMEAWPVIASVPS